MTMLIIETGEDKMPIRVVFDFQKYQPAEEVDGIVNPEIQSYVDITSLSFGGFAMDNMLNSHTVENIRKKCFIETNRSIT